MTDWIEWNGGECPVDPDVMVCVKFRDGDQFFSVPGGAMRAAFWFWSHDNRDGDIIAYRIISAADD